MTRPVLMLVCMISLNTVIAGVLERGADVGRVTIETGDLVLSAKLYPAHGSQPRPAIVLLHGWTWPENDPSWGMVSVALEFQQAGFTVLVPIMRGWAPSGGRDDCAGEQVDDALRALAWLGQQGQVDADNLFLAGYSQGGQVALLAAAQNAPVRAVAAFAPVVDPGSWGRETGVQGIREYVMEECGGPKGWQSRNVMNRTDSLRQPLLLVHGAADRRVPATQSTRLYQQLREQDHRVQLRLLPGVDHDQDRALRPRMAIEHFEQHLKRH